MTICHGQRFARWGFQVLDKWKEFVRRHACTCGPPPQDCVKNDEVLTQYGKVGQDFRSAPRVEEIGERALSMLRGRFAPAEAGRALRGRRLSPQEAAAARARYVTAGRLREAGFAVVHTVARVTNPQHVSVVWPDTDPLNRQDAPWPSHVSAAFTACFNEEGKEAFGDESGQDRS